MQPSVVKLENTIRALATECFNKVLPKGECDFAFDVAGSLPLMLISHIMNLPKEVWPDIYRWTYMSTSPEDPEFSIGTAEETSRVGTGKMMDYCLKLALERRENPGDDLLSDIALTEIDGKKLADVVVAFNATAFIAAGHETTRNALCGALAELIRNPAELEKLRALRGNPAALKLAVEEAVRWTAPLTISCERRRRTPKSAERIFERATGLWSGTMPRTGRGGIQGFLSFRHRAQSQSASWLRLWTAFLPGRQSRAARTSHHVRNPAGAHARYRTRRGAGIHVIHDSARQSSTCRSGSSRPCQSQADRRARYVDPLQQVVGEDYVGETQTQV
ncbi:MAG: cytochrome P450 [Rhizomicrobium sp.]